MTEPTGTAAAAVIQIKSFAYTGPDSVPAGAKVTVTNLDNQAHTVTADDGSFDAVVKPGDSVTFTAPTKPGSYTYHCTYHASMHGTLTVK
jgi:plastocyanin